MPLLRPQLQVLRIAVVSRAACDMGARLTALGGSARRAPAWAKHQQEGRQVRRGACHADATRTDEARHASLEPSTPAHDHAGLALEPRLDRAARVPHHLHVAQQHLGVLRTD